MAFRFYPATKDAYSTLYPKSDWTALVTLYTQ